jgi:hypothetical protein
MLQPATLDGTDGRPGGAPPAGFLGRVIHDVGGAGPIYAGVKAPDGRRYFTDELRHRVLVEEPNGYRWSFGTPGSGAAELRRPRGLAVVPGECGGESRVFVCDAWNHRIQVFDGRGRPCGGFGRAGRAGGQFDTPSDIVAVCPSFHGEEEPSPGATWLAVADRSNNRVQVFDLDGVLVGIVEGGEQGAQVHPVAERVGWPYFRVGAQPSMWFPERLAWKAPYLEVVSANREVVRIDLALALLPDFDTWLRTATPRELFEARSTLAWLAHYTVRRRTVA